MWNRGKGRDQPCDIGIADHLVGFAIKIEVLAIGSVPQRIHGRNAFFRPRTVAGGNLELVQRLGQIRTGPGQDTVETWIDELKGRGIVPPSVTSAEAAEKLPR